MPQGQGGEAAAWHTAMGGKPVPQLRVLSLFGFPLYLTLFCERLYFQDPCLMVVPSREVRCSTEALLLFICVAKEYQHKLHLSFTAERRCRL